MPTTQRLSAVSRWCPHGADRALAIALIGGGVYLAACRPSDVLSVPPPAGVTPSAVYQNQAGAEGLLTVGKAQVYQGLTGGVFDQGLLPWGGLLGDEFTWSYFTYGAADANVDARTTVGGGGFKEPGDAPLATLLSGRLTLLSAIPLLRRYEPSTRQSTIGEAFALIGYAEVLAAEDYCAGVPLDSQVAVQGISYGTPLTTDSLLAVAEADFDSAAVYAGTDTAFAPLVAVGLGRERLDRGRVTTAAAVVSGVPTGFVYNAGLQTGAYVYGSPNAFNLYDDQPANVGCGYVNIADRKGVNGLDYLSAQDPRLVLSTSVGETCDGLYSGSADSVWYYPVKFGNPSVYVPLATGAEARLIEAEAALKAGDANGWTTDLNALRANAAGTYLTLASGMSPLTPDSTTGASAPEQVDVMFRERAFWLFGTGTRLGDMRRLIRQYGRDQSTVFPTGPYANANNSHLPSPLPSFGTDVSLTLPTPHGGFPTPNPKYKGCISSTKIA